MSQMCLDGGRLKPATKSKATIHLPELAGSARVFWKRRYTTNGLNPKDDGIEITLSTEEGLQSFSTTKAVLTKQSTFFDTLLSQQGGDMNLGLELSCQHVEFELSCHPHVFDQFVQWVNLPRHPIKYKPLNYSKGNFWIEYAASAWFLAIDLGAIGFEKYALAQFIQNCSMTLFGPWRFIERNAAMGTSLRSFSNHWVTWNCHLSGNEEGEYACLKAAQKVGLVSAHTKDPRIYSLEHWYSTCGYFLGSCVSHNLSLRGQHIAVKKLMDEPAEDWGYKFERHL